MDAAKAALDGTDINAIKAAGEKLQEAGHKLAQVVYSQTEAETAQGAAASDMGSDVEEADYEVVDDE